MISLLTNLQYDFSKEDVPERDPEQVRKSMNDTCVLLDAVKVRMVSGFIMIKVNVDSFLY